MRELGGMIGSLSVHRKGPQIEVAGSEQTVALVFRVLAEPTDDDREKLRAFGELEGFDIYLQTGGPDSIRPLGAARVLEYSPDRSEEHTSELQSLMRISYAVFCLKKKK